MVMHTGIYNTIVVFEVRTTTIHLGIFISFRSPNTSIQLNMYVCMYVYVSPYLFLSLYIYIYIYNK